MDFKCFLEMASFSLPNPIEIDGKYVTLVDMQFEKDPRTINDSGKVMNNGSKFFAKMPGKDAEDYLAYDGAGMSKFISEKDIPRYKTLGFIEIAREWFKKAIFV